MKSFILSLVIYYALLFNVNAQSPLLPYYMDQPLTYNPSLAGSTGEDNIYMNITNLNFENNFKNLDPRIFPFMVSEPHLDDFRDGYYFAYIHCDSTSKNTKLSYGLELQKYRLRTYFVDPTSVGAFANFHFSILPNKINNLSASLGLKYDYIYRQVNTIMVQRIFEDELEAANVDFQEAKAFFSNAGRQFSYSAAIRYHIKERLLVSTGINYMRLRHKVYGNPPGAIFDPVFFNRNIGYGLLHLNFSVLLNKQLAVDLNILGGYATNIGGGLSFHVRDHTLYRINFSRSVVDLDAEYYTLAFNILVNRCNVNLALSAYSSDDTFQSYPNYIVQLGVGYSLEKEASLSLMRLE